jgi:mutator protein MutT
MSGETRRVALIILHDDEGRILLQQRTDDAPSLPGVWAYFGGGIEPGETPEEAVRREAAEELNATLAAPRMIFERAFALEGRMVHLFVFLDRYIGDKDRLELREGKDWGWFPAGEVEGLGMIPRDIIIARAAFRELAAR